MKTSATCVADHSGPAPGMLGGCGRWGEGWTLKVESLGILFSKPEPLRRCREASFVNNKHGL